MKPHAQKTSPFTRKMKAARKKLEAEQGEPLDLDQVTTIESLCASLNIEPRDVLGSAMDLIDAPVNIPETFTEGAMRQ